MEESQTPARGAKRRMSENYSGSRSSTGKRGTKRPRHSTMGLIVENGTLLEVNRMELRSGRNLLKYSVDGSELAGVPATPVKKSNIKRTSMKSTEKENKEPATTCISIENTQARKSSESKLNRRKSYWEEEKEDLATTYIPVENTSDRKSRQTKLSRGKSNLEQENEILEPSDLTPSQERDVSSTQVTENVEKNDDLSDLISDQNKEDVAEILNSTFEVTEEDSILQTPGRKRSVRFATAVETRRRTASFSNTADNTPKCSTPVSVNKEQRSEYKGTPHPSAKKRPGSILKVSSSRNHPCSSKDKSLSGRGSARKMPDFSSIHKAQFEKMESIDDFSYRRRKCARKLEAQTCQAVDGKLAKPKQSAIVKPMARTAGNALSRIPLAPKSNCNPGTPRPSSSSHLPIANFCILPEKSFDAHRSTPHRITSRPSFTKTGSTSRPKPVNNLKPQRITYEQAKATILNKKPLAAVKREAEKLENRNILKGVRLNRRFELQMQHRKLNM